MSYGRRGLKSCEGINFRDFARLYDFGDNMVNFRKYLQQSKDMKYEALSSKRESEPNPYSCNYSPCSGHKYCEHAHCILDPEWLRKDKCETILRNKIKTEESYLQNGKGTVGYDMKSVYMNVLKLKKELKDLLGEG